MDEAEHAGRIQARKDRALEDTIRLPGLATEGALCGLCGEGKRASPGVIVSIIRSGEAGFFAAFITLGLGLLAHHEVCPETDGCLVNVQKTELLEIVLFKKGNSGILGSPMDVLNWEANRS